ncbi:MAG: HlyC/CorC family transporter [Deltaproteobacteria bacterium]|nr:HlyC/CorC family transporter [Deltaproteobacteria bacterium]MBW2634120.1 HlyC/CorC family transporter [Deltaproteobacteria bacterium]
MTDQIFVLLVLVILSGFFSSAETSLFSISKTKAIHLAKNGTGTYRLIRRMKSDPHTLLTTILIGNNLVNVAAAALATSIAMESFPNFAISIATGGMTFLILVFGEVFPKSIATRNNVLIARIAIYPVYWLSLLFYPIIKFLNFIPWLTGRIRKPQAVTEEELMTFVEVVEEEGEIKEEEKELIHNIFEFDDTNASEIMTPRADMFVIDITEELKIETIIDSGFSRIPVIHHDIDDVIGVLNIKDLFRHLASGDENIDIAQIMKKPYVVPENKKLDNLLRQFKKTKTHIAIVIDEHGGVAGLITLEDALEELVGEIVDETDKEEPHIVRLKPKTWMILGKTDIDDVNDELGMEIPDSATYDTFSGYILDAIEKIPAENEEITLGRYVITVKEKDGNRIIRYTVKEMDSPEQAGRHESEPSSSA